MILFDNKTTLAINQHECGAMEKVFIAFYMSYLCCSVPGYGHEAGPALQPGKSLRDPEAALHWLQSCPWQPGNYTPPWKP